jgi:hypothetical protein
MKPSPATIDVPLSTLDQAAPVTDKPIGRLSTLINAQVKQFQNPRFNVQDGSVAHVKVEKRDAFVTMDTTTRDTAGAPKDPPSGTPQVFFGGGDALRMIVNNRLYTKTKNWVEDTNAIDGDTAVFPQTLRSTPIYTADSTAEAPDMAVIGDVRCVVWRELSESNSSDWPEGVSGTPPAPVPTDFDGVRVQFSTSSGIMVPAFTLDPIGGAPQYLKARVVAYDGVFWVLQDSIPAGDSPYGGGIPKDVPIDITIFDTNGVQLGHTSIATGSYNEYWDVTTMDTQGVVVAMPAGGTGVTFTALTWDGSAFSITTNTDTSISCGACQCAWLTDSTQAANTGYLATVDDPTHPPGGLSSSSIHAWRIVSLAQNLAYPTVVNLINQATLHYISAITGYHVPGGDDLVVAYTVMDLFSDLDASTYGATHPDEQNSEATDQFPDQINNTTVTASVVAGGTSTNIARRYGMSLVTRPFTIGSDYCVIGYYPARIFGPLSTSAASAPHYPNRPVNPSNFQPTWYVIPLALTQPIAGRFEYGLASADYQIMTYHYSVGPTSIDPGSRNRCLTTPCVLSTGAIAMPLGYRAEQNIPSVELISGTAQQGGALDSYSLGSYSSGNTVGVKMFTIGPDCGRPFIVGQASYYPGLMGGVVEPFDATITEHGLAAPECPRVLKSALTNLIGPPATIEGSRSYRSVFEWTTSTGRLYRSLPSAAFSYTIVNSNNLAIAIQVHNLFPTLKKNVKISVYATGQIGAVKDGTAIETTPPTVQPGTPISGTAESVSSYKITNDLQPLYSDPTTQISAFNDYYFANQQASGEQLYTDQGQLPRYPAPAHRGGCVWLNRPWIIGYDNALWFGGEIVEGEGEYFNPGMRVVVPTNEEIVSITPMDSFLLIHCTKSIWYLPESASLPSNTGVGSIPTAIRLPFEMGGTGFTAVIRQGCMYSSSQGGVWMITRSLDNVWIGQNAKDDLAPTITGMCIAGNNVLVSNGSYVMAYDTNLGAWGRWNFSASPTLITAFGGVGMFNDNGLVWVQTPGAYLDNDRSRSETYYVPMTATISPVHVGGIRSWKRTWEVQVQGQVADYCDVNFTLAYGDYNANLKTYQSATLVPGVLEEAIRPTLQLATSIGLTVTDAANEATTTGQGFSLEVMSLYVGLEKGLKKLPPGARAKT